MFTPSVRKSAGCPWVQARSLSDNFLFGKFFKGSNAVRGSGIGLALVDSIMNALDGTLDLRSTLGKGTVVTLGLPLYKKL